MGEIWNSTIWTQRIDFDPECGRLYAGLLCCFDVQIEALIGKDQNEAHRDK